MLANQSHKNKESVNYVINHFKRDFRECLNSDVEVEHKLFQELEYNQVASVML